MSCQLRAFVIKIKELTLSLVSVIHVLYQQNSHVFLVIVLFSVLGGVVMHVIIN
jgi:hypothetical protein